MTDSEIIERLAQGEDSRTQFKVGPIGVARTSIYPRTEFHTIGKKQILAVFVPEGVPSAAALRALAENVIENESKHVTLDFDGAPMCSTAFIDELVGKLVVRYGFLDFTQKVSLVNVRGLSAQLVNHSIVQRLAEGAKGVS
ncbi:MAG: STAS-like domain-containing protein [Kiritimatiellae bacterium]|nr:STAS-like domain-containing protein [Kiritimatiellia bacterium]